MSNFRAPEIRIEQMVSAISITSTVPRSSLPPTPYLNSHGLKPIGKGTNNTLHGGTKTQIRGSFADIYICIIFNFRQLSARKSSMPLARSLVKNRSGRAWALLVSALNVVWLICTPCVCLIARAARKGVLFLDVKKEKKGEVSLVCPQEARQQ